MVEKVLEMTTKPEFDSFIAGFKLAGHEHISMDQLDAILAKVDDLVAGLTAPAAGEAETAAVSDAAGTVDSDTTQADTAVEETASEDTVTGTAEPAASEIVPTDPAAPTTV